MSPAVYRSMDVLEYEKPTPAGDSKNNKFATAKPTTGSRNKSKPKLDRSVDQTNKHDHHYSKRKDWRQESSHRGGCERARSPRKRRSRRTSIRGRRWARARGGQAGQRAGPRRASRRGRGRGWDRRWRSRSTARRWRRAGRAAGRSGRSPGRPTSRISAEPTATATATASATCL